MTTASGRTATANEGSPSPRLPVMDLGRIELARRRRMLANLLVDDGGGVRIAAVPLAGLACGRFGAAEPPHAERQVMIDAMMPSPGAAKVVVPKYGIGMALLIEGDPGSADMVNVNAPRQIVAGIRRRGIFAARNIFCAIGTSTKKATKTLTPP